MTSHRPVLDWLQSASTDRGIHFSEDQGTWNFWSYDRLASASDHLAGAFADAGVRVGDGVVIVERSGPGFVASLFGAMAAGAVPTPVAPPMAFHDAGAYRRHVLGLLEVARPALVVTGPSLTGEMSELAVTVGAPVLELTAELLMPIRGDRRIGDAAADRPCLLQFTSGSTGRPRGVVVSFAALAANVAAIRSWLRMGRDDATASWLPVHHDMGLIGCLVTPIVNGSDIWLLRPEQFVRQPLRYLRCFSEGQARLSAMPVFGLDHVSRRVKPAQLAGLDLSEWRALIVGAERVDPRVLDRFRDLLAPHGFCRQALLPAYGLAEATLAVSGLAVEESWVSQVVEPASLAVGRSVEPAGAAGGVEVVGCGRPLGDLTVEVVDEHGAVLTEGYVGEIVVRGPSVGAGYAAPDDTGQLTRFRAGLLCTGDAGFVAGGQLFVLGRLGDSLKVRGRWVFAEDLEAALGAAGFPRRQAAVCLGVHAGVPTVVCLLEKPRGDEAQRARALLRRLTEGATVVLVDLPRGGIQRTSSGKPKRRAHWRAFVGGGRREAPMLAGTVPWPEDLVERYRNEGWWRDEVLGDLVDRWSADTPERTALVAAGRRWSYAELALRADRVAAGLHGLGIVAGDRVVVHLPNTPDFVATSLALFRLGALPVYALAAHRRSEIEYLCRSSEAAAYIAADRFQGFDYGPLAAEILRRSPTVRHAVIAGESSALPTLDDLVAGGDRAPRLRPDPHSVAFFLLSGGTTGLPKLIPRTHADYACQLRATAGALGVDQDSSYLAVVPASHNAALGCPGVLGTLRVGGKVVLAASPSPDDVFAPIQDEKVTLTTVMPPIVALWLELAPAYGADMSNLILQVGGARLDPDLARRAVEGLGARLTHWFGMAEGPLSYTRLDDPPEVVFHTQGRPLLGADEFCLADGEDQPVAPGGRGELLVRGPTTIRGYYRAPEDNAAQFTPDGFLRTGDLATIDAAGNMAVVGRVKDVINRGGEKISPEELEEHLLAHPQVRRVAVVAAPDARLGEKTWAFLVAEAPLGLAAVHGFLSDRGLAAFKLPDKVVLVDALPLTAVGKVDRRQLGSEAARRIAELR